MAKKKQWRFAMAMCLVGGPKAAGEKATVDLQQAAGRQLIATVAHDDRGDDGKKFLQLHFADIWHVDDPSAPQCERSQDALKMLPKELRRSPESFAKSDGKSASGNPSGNGNGVAAGAGTVSSAATPPVTAGAAMSADELLS